MPQNPTPTALTVVYAYFLSDPPTGGSIYLIHTLPIARIILRRLVAQTTGCIQSRAEQLVSVYGFRLVGITPPKGIAILAGI